MLRRLARQISRFLKATGTQQRAAYIRTRWQTLRRHSLFPSVAPLPLNGAEQVSGSLIAKHFPPTFDLLGGVGL